MLPSESDKSSHVSEGAKPCPFPGCLLLYDWGWQVGFGKTN